MLRSLFNCVAKRTPVINRKWLKIHSMGSIGFVTALHLASNSDDSSTPLPIMDTKECLKHAALASVNSSSVLLTTTYFLIDKISERYKSLLSSILGIIDECVLLEGWNEELWEEVISVRLEMETVKAELTFLMGHIALVDKIVLATIETTFNLNANYLSTNLCEQSFSAQEKLVKLEQEINELEKMYLLAQTQVAKYRIEDNK